jgi:phosphoglycerate dehydrogenase-like enzyme
MRSLCVLEYIRHKDPVWNLPRPLMDDLQARFPDVRFVSPADPAEVDRLLPEADVVLGWAVRPENFARATRLRWIQIQAASVAALLFPALVESPVIVTNGRGLHAVSMAEHTLGVILMFARQLHLARDAQRERRWAQSALADRGAFAGLAGATLGLVGFGAIGHAIAERARPFGMRVIAVRRHPDPVAAPADEQWGVERLDELIANADWLVLSPPLTAATRGMIGGERLARMKRGAVLINLGRGPLVDEVALVDALERGALAGAGLDVFDREPLAESSRLWGMPQVILTPHVSGLGPRLWERGMELFVRNLEAFRAGRPLENLVDKRAGY